MSIFEGKKQEGPRAFNRTVNLDQQWGPTDCKPATNDDHFRAIQQELAQEYRERYGEIPEPAPPPQGSTKACVRLTGMAKKMSVASNK